MSSTSRLLVTSISYEKCQKDAFEFWYAFFFLPFIIKFLMRQLIYIGEFTKALDKSWHIEHFACHSCDVPLTGKKYIVNKHQPFCQRCFTENIANRCCVCKKPIGPESKDLFVKDKHYHKECLVCSKCHCQLVSNFFHFSSISAFSTNTSDVYRYFRIELEFNLLNKR